MQYLILDFDSIRLFFHISGNIQIFKIWIYDVEGFLRLRSSFAILEI